MGDNPAAPAVLVLLFKLFEVIFSTINELPSRVFVSASVFTPTRDTGPASRGARFQVPDEQRGKCQELERTPACLHRSAGYR